MTVLLAGCKDTQTPADTTKRSDQTASPGTSVTSAPRQTAKPESVSAKSINDGREASMKYAVPENVKTLVLPDVIGNNMLFQQNKPVVVWGFAPAGTSVTVELYKDKDGLCVGAVTAKVPADHTFAINLSSVKGGFDTYTLEIKNGETVRTYTNILFGELYMASGQSNMQVTLNETIKYNPDAVTGAANKFVRVYNPPIVPMKSGKYPFTPVLNPDCATDHNWTVPDGSYTAMSGVSAVGYAMAQQMYELLGSSMPVGLLSLPVGGTSISSWLPRYVIEANPALQKKSLLSNHYMPSNNFITEEAYKTSPYNTYNYFAALYHTKIAPVGFMNIAGLVWYQGETDAGYKGVYTEILEALIQGWSLEFGYQDASLPTVVVQLAPHYAEHSTDVAGLTEFNMEYVDFVRKNPATRGAVAIYDVDLSYHSVADNHTVHPKVKEPVGQRCAFVMNGLLYASKPDGWLSPQYASDTVSGNKMTVTLSSAGKGLKASDGLPIRGFAIAGTDKKYYQATAQITAADQVELYSPYVDEPAYVAYAYSAVNMTCNLVNANGLPVIPFCTKKSSSLYAPHDWTWCDLSQVWRYEGLTGGLVQLYSASCAWELSAEAVRGKAIALNGSGDYTLKVHTGYQGDIHQYNSYSSLSFYVKGGAEVTSVTLYDKAGNSYALDLKGVENSDQWKLYTYSLDSGSYNNQPKGRLSYTHSAQMDSLVIAFKGSKVLVDEFSLGNK